MTASRAGKMHKTHGLFRRTAARTCHSRDGQGDIGTRMAKRAFCQSRGDRRADGAVFGNQGQGNAEGFILGLVGINHKAPFHDRRRARDFREIARNQTAGAGFRRYDFQSGLAIAIKECGRARQ